MMLAEIALVCFLLVCGYSVYLRRSHARQCLAHLPTFPQLPLIGSAHYLLGGQRQIFQRLIEVKKISEKTQKPFVIWMGPYPCLILSDLDDIKAVTSEFVEKPFYYSFFQEWLGDGIFSAPVAVWKRNIKKLGRIFTTSVLDEFQDTFNSQAKKFVQNLKIEAGKDSFVSKKKDLAAVTLEATLLSGVQEILDSTTISEYNTELHKLTKLIYIRGYKFFLHFDWIFEMTSYKREMMEAVDKLNHISDTIIKIKQEEDCKRCNNLHSEDPKRNFKSYLDVLLELNANDPTFTMEQVRNEINTIILAAQDTTSISLFFTLLLIGRHAEVQDKIYAEMKTIFGDSKREVCKGDLIRMSYCEAVINESLRLYPPIPLISRVANHDLKLKSCTVPKGAICIINLLNVGRSKNHWGPDAEEFRPDRFESTSLTDWIASFGVGRRACIGKKYAMSIMKTIIAYCVRDLEFYTESDEIELKMDIMLRPVNENLLKVRRRES